MSDEVRAHVEAGLREIPEPYRAAVVLRDLEGLSYEEIAEVLEISLGTVKSRLMRGREHLRKRLERFAKDAGLNQEKQSRPVRQSGWKMEVETGR